MRYLDDFFNLFFPNVCCLCGRSLFQHENLICRLCEKDLPRSYFHFLAKNPVEMTFWGRVDIQKGTSFLLYVKGSKVKNILHAIKYRNNRQLGYELGKLYGLELNENNYFADIDLVVPVPIHPKKLRIRGYNQSEYIAQGLCDSLQKTLQTEGLRKVVNTKSQTRKGRFERWENVSDVFKIDDDSLFCGKNILLVDDVLTTGATLESCARCFSKVPDVTLSIATLAYATI